ncbi:uncharacterized protein LOC127260350 isoform X2 [Andrographis paniculata]|uniref:uncharacterized protein LOC127260350 isoform X2 n=1 Tax=Andrographis paniculata TaxID=175694 RepID=UPI0021E8C636|nr:uncharacterized protein LOC127260350 isoform X2 [Andrographis paniculata]
MSISICMSISIKTTCRNPYFTPRTDHLTSNLNLRHDEYSTIFTIKRGKYYEIYTRGKKMSNINRRNATSSSSSSPSSSSNENHLASWKKWLIGFVFSIVLPAAGHKGGIFTPLKDIIENIADQADKLVDEIESKLPEDSNLVETVEKLDKLTDIALEKAKQAEEIVQQVKEVKDHIFEHVIQDDNTDDDTTKANK